MYYAFDQQRLLASGSEPELRNQINSYIKQHDTSNILCFNQATGRQVDMDFRAGDSAVGVELDSPVAGDEASESEPAKKPRGRPKLGVIGREVTLLPRHWQWLDKQRGGASAALRRLVDEARKGTIAEERIRESQDSANRFMYAMAGNLQGFEEAVRALYARDSLRFEAETADWPLDIRRCARQYAESALA